MFSVWFLCSKDRCLAYAVSGVKEICLTFSEIFGVLFGSFRDMFDVVY